MALLEQKCNQAGEYKTYCLASESVAMLKKAGYMKRQAEQGVNSEDDTMDADLEEGYYASTTHAF